MLVGCGALKHLCWWDPVLPRTKLNLAGWDWLRKQWWDTFLVVPFPVCCRTLSERICSGSQWH